MGSAYGPATLLFDSRPSQVAPKYRDNRGAVINADGQAVKLGTVEYESNPGAVPTRVFIRVNIPDDEALLRLSKAHMIDGTVGMNRFRLSPAQLEGLQDFVRHVLDPQLPVNRPPAPSRPAAKVGPDRNTIPKGQGILHFGDGKRPCSIVPDLRSLDEIDEIVSALPSAMKWDPAQSRDLVKRLTSKVNEQVKAGKRILVPSGTAVKVLEKRKRPDAVASRSLTKVEVLDGPHKGLIGWCLATEVSTSLKDSDDPDKTEPGRP